MEKFFKQTPISLKSQLEKSGASLIVVKTGKVPRHFHPNPFHVKKASWDGTKLNLGILWSASVAPSGCGCIPLVMQGRRGLILPLLEFLAGHPCLGSGSSLLSAELLRILVVFWSPQHRGFMHRQPVTQEP